MLSEAFFSLLVQMYVTQETGLPLCTTRATEHIFKKYQYFRCKQTLQIIFSELCKAQFFFIVAFV